MPALGNTSQTYDRALPRPPLLLIPDTKISLQEETNEGPTMTAKGDAGFDGGSMVMLPAAATANSSRAFLTTPSFRDRTVAEIQ